MSFLGLVAVEVLAVALLLPGAALFAVALRRRLLQRAGGTIELSLRYPGVESSGGWVNGVGRFDRGGELRWYRVFSLSARPRRVLLRRQLEVLGRREPSSGERRALQEGAVVLECRLSGANQAAAEVELALDGTAVTGFLAWLESRPPGATLPR